MASTVAEGVFYFLHIEDNKWPDQKWPAIVVTEDLVTSEDRRTRPKGSSNTAVFAIERDNEPM